MEQKWIGTQIVLNHITNNSLHKNDYLKKKLALAKESLELKALIIWLDLNKKKS